MDATKKLNDGAAKLDANSNTLKRKAADWIPAFPLYTMVL